MWRCENMKMDGTQISYDDYDFYRDIITNLRSIKNFSHFHIAIFPHLP